MKFRLSDNQIVRIDTPFTLNDIQYPAEWLRSLSVEERNAFGAIEIDDYEPIVDGRFYWSHNNPKPVETVKAMLVSQVIERASSILQQTDWMVIRSIEDATKPIPSDVVAFRQAVRDASRAFGISINEKTTVEELAAMQFTFPTM